MSLFTTKITPELTALILAGGRGSRMGGVDKGLQLFRGKALVAHTIERLQTQEVQPITKILINANRNVTTYEAFGSTVCVDAQPGEFAGPLAGFLTGLQHCNTPYLLTVPCDTPLFPFDLAQRLVQRLEAEHADIAVACAAEGQLHEEPLTQPKIRQQPVFCLMKTTLEPSLQDFMAAGGRKIDRWTAQHRVAEVVFDNDPWAFFNMNTLQELQSLEQNAV